MVATLRDTYSALDTHFGESGCAELYCRVGTNAQSSAECVSSGVTGSEILLDLPVYRSNHHLEPEIQSWKIAGFVRSCEEESTITVPSLTPRRTSAMAWKRHRASPGLSATIWPSLTLQSGFGNLFCHPQRRQCSFFRYEVDFAIRSLKKCRIFLAGPPSLDCFCWQAS